MNKTNTKWTKDNYKWKLLGTGNPKTLKGQKKGYMTYIMHMSPFNHNSMGVNICPMASPGCATACLNHSGRGGIFKGIEESRIRKTEFYLNDRIGFLDKLIKEIGNKKRYHEKKKDYIPVFRLNGTSDIRWEKQKASNGRTIFETFPGLQFYDYTKIPNRFFQDMPKNYHLTFSRSEKNDKACDEVLAAGFNVAYVFDKLPTEWNGYKVIDADETDLRFLDKKNVIVGLKYKKMTSKGFDNATFVKENDFIINTGL